MDGSQSPVYSPGLADVPVHRQGGVAVRIVRGLISNRRRLALVACLIVASGIAAAVAFAGPHCGYVTESQYRQIAIGMSSEAVVGILGYQTEFVIDNLPSADFRWCRMDVYEGVEGLVVLMFDVDRKVSRVSYGREPFWQLWSKRVYDKLERIWVGKSTTV
jgi:hypothetical protein